MDPREIGHKLYSVLAENHFLENFRCEECGALFSTIVDKHSGGKKEWFIELSTPDARGGFRRRWWDVREDHTCKWFSIHDVIC